MVSITWSSTNGGTAITEPLNHGSGAAGSNLTDQEIFIRHDGTNSITNCGFYLVEKSGTYGGGASASLDLAEMFTWADNSTAAGFGGVLLNMDATGSYASGWSTYGSKSATTYNVFRADTGDTAANKIVLATEMGLTGAVGTIQAGTTSNVRFKCRIKIPTNEGTVGIRQFDMRLQYSYTS